jgi:hypothetical protein
MTKKKARGLGTNPLATHPLDAIIPDRSVEVVEEVTGPGRWSNPKRKERFSSYISADAAETLRDIAWWLRIPLAALIDSAFRREIEAREKENGGPFKRRQSDLLKGSRP